MAVKPFEHGGGSPPRAWGRHRTCGTDHRRGRFTPTCVGTTPHLWHGSPSRTVHPHVRGDDVAERLVDPAADGSPPRAWGRRPGEALTASWWSVHPHVRGDDADSSSQGASSIGSPPRAWGRPR